VFARVDEMPLCIRYDGGVVALLTCCRNSEDFASLMALFFSSEGENPDLQVWLMDCMLKELQPFAKEGTVCQCIF